VQIPFLSRPQFTGSLQGARWCRHSWIVWDRVICPMDYVMIAPEGESPLVAAVA